METNSNFDFYLQRLGIKNLNEMQQKVLEQINENPQQVIISATGSGKTLAFLLPLLQTLNSDLKQTQALILTPSRELALQIEEVFKKMQTGFKVLTCYGGHKREIEEKSLVEAPAVIIGTTGRIADHIRRGNVNFSKLDFLVVDEYDKMLELGFAEEMKFILEKLPVVKNKILTSATIQTNFPEYLNMSKALTLNFLDENAIASDVLRIHTILSPDKDKLETLFNFLCFANDTSTIVFCNHREAVERTNEFIHDKGIISVFYHGGMEQRDREVALTKFRNGTSTVLITTDLASRGLDIENIRNIVHYHIPHDEASFTHRNGRTARQGKTGNVYVIYSSEENLPGWITDEATEFDLPAKLELPPKPKWSTLFIDAGKKDKISKGDIAGFLMQKGHLRQEDVGLIEVKDFMAFAAVRKSKASALLQDIKEEKLKGRKIKIAVAK